jgi:hypothetical protein
VRALAFLMYFLCYSCEPYIAGASICRALDTMTLLSPFTCCYPSLLLIVSRVVWWFLYNISYKKKQWEPTIKRGKGGKHTHTCLSPRKKEACHRIGTALLQSIAKIGTQSNIKRRRKTLQKFSPHILQTPSKGSNYNVSTDKMLYVDITVRLQ